MNGYNLFTDNAGINWGCGSLKNARRTNNKKYKVINTEDLVRVKKFIFLESFSLMLFVILPVI